MAFGFLFFAEWNVLQIVFTFVGVILGTVLNGGQRVFGGLERCEGVGHRFVVHLVAEGVAHHCLVRALPVVFVLALSPLLLEGGLSLGDGQLVVEIPFAFLLLLGDVGLVLAVHVLVAGVVAGQGLLGSGFLLGFPLFFLFLFQGFYHAVDGFVALFLGHFREGQQGVLEMDGFGEGGQFIEDF